MPQQLIQVSRCTGLYSLLLISCAYKHWAPLDSIRNWQGLLIHPDPWDCLCVWRPCNDNVNILRMFLIALASEIRSNTYKIEWRPSWNPVWRVTDVESDIAKPFPDIKNIGIDSWTFVLGAVEQEIWANIMLILAAIFEFNMAATRRRAFFRPGNFTGATLQITNCVGYG